MQHDQEEKQIDCLSYWLTASQQSGVLGANVQEVAMRGESQAEAEG